MTMSSQNIIVSAPGKVILHGEHAVVYGKPALAASINLRSYLTLSETDCHPGRVSIELPAINVNHSWSTQELQMLHDAINIKQDIESPLCPSEDVLDKISVLVNKDKPESTDPCNLAVSTVLYMYTALCCSNGTPSLSIKVVSQLPVGAGLGSSASFSVCLATALLLRQGHVQAPSGNAGDAADSGNCGWTDHDLDLINKWAYQGETIIHGQPSGIDNSVATYGGAIRFQCGKIKMLKKIASLRILLTSTNIPRSTKVLVAKVKAAYDKFPDIMKPVMDAIGQTSEKCQQIYETIATDLVNLNTNLETLGELLDINQHLLQTIGVSHVTLDTICNVTSKYRLHSKLTGAGGGGCAFTLLFPSTGSEVIENIKTELEPAGIECWETGVGVGGVMVVNSLPSDLLS